MTEQNPQQPAATDKWLEPGKTNLQVIYICYLVSLVIGVTALVGIVLAYVNRGKSEPWLETHYTWAIRTFWITLLYALIAVALFIVLIGVPLMLAVAALMIIRVVIGLQRLNRGEAIAKPESWLI